MLNKHLVLLIAGMVLMLAMRSVDACGPFFPNRVLLGGDNAIIEAPIASFRSELDHIKPSMADHLQAIMPEENQDQYEQSTQKDLADLEHALDTTGIAPQEKRNILTKYEQART
jgi:2-iminoacetate synthase ThiH